MSTTYIAVNSDLDSIVDWVRVNIKGKIEDQGRGSISDVISQFTKDSYVIVTPANWGRRVRVNLPTRNRTQATQAIPYMLEEQVAEDIDRLHFAIGNQDKDNNYRVIITRKADMSRLINFLEKHGIQPQRIISELQGLPFKEKHWTLVCSGNNAILRVDEFHVSEVSQAVLPQIFPILLQEHGKPDGLEVYGNIITTAFQNLPIKQHPLEAAGLLPFIIENSNQANTVNLLQGEYQTQNPYERLLMPWKNIAIFTLVLLGFTTVVKGFEVNKLKAEEEMLRDNILRTYQTALPNNRFTTVSQAKRNLQQALSEARNGSNQDLFLTLNAALAAQYSSVSNVKITNMTYSQNKNSLTIDIEASNYDKIEKLRQQLASSIKTVKLLNSSENKGIHIGRIRLSSGEN